MKAAVHASRARRLRAESKRGPSLPREGLSMMMENAWPVAKSSVQMVAPRRESEPCGAWSGSGSGVGAWVRLRVGVKVRVRVGVRVRVRAGVRVRVRARARVGVEARARAQGWG